MALVLRFAFTGGAPLPQAEEIGEVVVRGAHLVVMAAKESKLPNSFWKQAPDGWAFQDLYGDETLPDACSLDVISHSAGANGTSADHGSRRDRA